ncbi:Lrp/AsnC family transcriptional regulator [Marinifilum fragile]|uniref:Lrp/AsnC family transcriptional regulator n=1 Tax=Marinifilum fragile TaxID=570161 RepID=UPI002AA609A5|nr:Lrp/AsnC family transcriptional regulator [Marinifilum fragile]
MDSIDKKILNILQDNAKISNREIGEKFHLSRTPIFDRIRKMERKGIIRKYITLLNPKKVGRDLTVFCFVSLKHHSPEFTASFKKEIDCNPKVFECYHIAGNHDFFLKVMIKDVEEYYNFVSTELAVIENIAQVQSSFVLKELKYELKIDLTED